MSSNYIYLCTVCHDNEEGLKVLSSPGDGHMHVAMVIHTLAKIANGYNLFHSARSSHFYHCSVYTQPIPLVSFSHRNIFKNNDKMN